jgi:hypothetical protein
VRPKASPVSESEPVIAPSSNASPQNATPTVGTQDAELSIPNRETIRAEVEKNPHETPPSLLKFSIELGRQFKIAMLSEKNARSFFKKLEECVTDPTLQGADSSQALCLRDAQRLARAFPSLQGLFNNLSDEASPQARRLGLLSTDRK